MRRYGGGMLYAALPLHKTLFSDSNPWPTSHQDTTLPLHQGSPSLINNVNKEILIYIGSGSNIKICKRIILTIICGINWGKSKLFKRNWQIWVIEKITSTCNSNNGSEDFNGVRPLSWPPHKPSETILGGTTMHTL